MRLESADHIPVTQKMPPSIYRGYREMIRALWADSTLDIPLREMLRLKSAELARCRH